MVAIPSTRGSSNLPNPGIEPLTLMSLALAGEFFTNSATWEAIYIYIYRHRDQWNRIEIPEINSHIYGQLIFYNCATIIKWESNHLFNTWCRENRIFTCKRVNLDPVLVPVYEINSKWIKDSNIRAKTIKLLE